MKTDRVLEQAMNHTARVLGGAFRDYVRDVLADEGVHERRTPDRAEQRWEDEGGSSR